MPTQVAKERGQTLFLPEKLLRLPVYLMFLLASEGRRQAEGRGWKFLIPHYALLSSLEEFGPSSQKELSRRIGFDESDLVRLVDMLEREGLVERRIDPRDRRRHALTLTAKGRRRATVTGRELTRRVAVFLGALTAHEQEQLRRLLLRALAPHDPRVRADAS
ncbi:MAG TPA: MarR family winged helix-turn-helix transcriptional regulator [Myxococcales bacterium]|nr:MarR family winged helix-turn-helix transcriptional regulator [Myxococcales bacterium]